MTERYIDPWGYFEMDDDTGLPATPEGMFFRVRRLRTQGYWHVELRRKTRYGSRVVEYTVEDWDSEYRPLSQETVLHDAAYVMWRLRDRAKHNHDLSLLGDYPPKTLNPKE